jgi:LytR cell envelope-related transcriptional attenuator
MTDFFDDLERQLVSATAERGPRLRRARLRRAAALSTILLALLAGGAGIAAAVGGGGADDPGAPAGATTAPAPVPVPAGAPPALRSFVTAVLNGTAVPGLGGGVATRLQSKGARIGNVTNAPAQDVTTTLVYYARPDGVPAATKVADAIGLRGDTTLRALTPQLRAVAGDGADVVVVAGADQNTSPTP